MKILFLNWAPIIKYGIAEGFRELGIDIEILNPEEDTTSGMLKRIAACKPDLLFTEGGINREHIILEVIEKSKIPHVYWAIEDPIAYNLSLVYGRKSVLTCTTHLAWIQEIYQPNGVRAIFVPFACNPKWHKRGAYDPLLAHTFAFMGNNYNAHPYRTKGCQTMFQPLIDTGSDIVFYGNENWLNRKFPFYIPEKLYHGYLAYERLPNLCASAPFMLGIHSVGNSTTMQSMRTFEVMGCGGFFFTHHSKAVENMFKNHKHLVWSTSQAETLETYHFYESHPETMKKIRQEGQQFVYQFHTYKHRALEILDALPADLRKKAKIN